MATCSSLSDSISTARLPGYGPLWCDQATPALIRGKHVVSLLIPIQVISCLPGSSSRELRDRGKIVGVERVGVCVGWATDEGWIVPSSWSTLSVKGDPVDTASQVKARCELLPTPFGWFLYSVNATI